MAARKTTTFSVAALGGSPLKRNVGATSRRASEPPAAETTAGFSPAPSGGERVKVVIRCRPTRPDETPGALRFKPDGTGLVALKRDAYGAADFTFDTVLTPAASQADCYDAAVKPVVVDVLKGYNATLLAYGMTGSGKTYTLGSIRADAVGMIPRAAAEVFAAVAADAGHQYTVHLSYLQVYCEQIQDLLCPESGDNLAIREGEGGVWVPGLRQVEVRSLDDCLRLLQLGDRNRTVALTTLNAHSSRSHAVVTLTVEKRHTVGSVTTAAGEPAAAQRVRVGKLFMVDLAGSERLKKSGSTGQRASEAKAINLSLTTLGMCVNARADPAATHVPFRDSKLTRLLQESLGGNAKTSLVVAVSEAMEHCEETLQSLVFGTRAMRVVTQARVNERVDVGGAPRGGAETAALLAALHGADDRRSALEQALLERAGALEEVQAQLRAEREQSSQVVRALQQERMGAEARAEALLQEHATRLQAEEQHRMTLQERLEAAEAGCAELSRRYDGDRAALEAAVDAHRQAEAEARAAAAEQAERHSQTLHELRRQWRGDKEELQRAHAADATDAAARHESQLRASLCQLQDVQHRLAAAQAQQCAAADEHARVLSNVNAEWEERLQQALDRAQHQQREAVAAAAARHASKLDLEQQQARSLAKKLEALEAQHGAAVTDHAKKLGAASAEWAERLQRAEDSAQRQQQEGLAAAATRHASELEAVRQQARILKQRLAVSEAERCAAEDEHAKALSAVDSQWAQRLQQAEDSAERQQQEVAAEVAARDEEIAELRGAVKHGELKIVQTKGTAKQLQSALAQMRAAVTMLQERLAAAEQAAAVEKQRATEAEAYAEEQQQARMAMASSFLQRKCLNDAARTIQRAYRVYRLRALNRQRTEGYQALHKAQHALGSMAQQHADLERRRLANLAFAGQTLVADSLGVLQDAVETLVSTFLLPAKDLKSLQKYRQKTGAGAALAALPGADSGVLFPPAEPLAGGVRRASGGMQAAGGSEFIRAFNPAAASTRSSAWGSQGTSPPKSAWL